MRAHVPAVVLLLLVAACGGSTAGDLGGSSSSSSSSSGSSSSSSSSSGSSSSSSSSGGVDAGSDAGWLACMNGDGKLDTSMKTCTTNDDCVIKQEMTDCCGTILFVGVARVSVTAFGACEAAWEAHFPGCGCASGRTSTEDGKLSGPGQDAGAPQVRCATGGTCLTFTP